MPPAKKFVPATLLIICAVVALAPKTVFAHAFGQTYTLPVPLWLFIYGAAAAVIVSFLVIGLFMNKKPDTEEYKTLKVMTYNSKLKWLLIVTKFLSVFLLTLTIVAGFIGTQDSYNNFSVLFFWIIFLPGVTYLSALVGNVWQAVNPLKVIVEIIESLTGKQFIGVKSYPKKLSYYPALIIYFLFIWLELFSNGVGVVPYNLALMLVIYIIGTVSLAYIYGKNSWFKYGEFFSVFFDVVAKISPLEYTRTHIKLRWPFVGLTKHRAGNFSMLLFILFMLASTGFDGLKETDSWHYFVTFLPLGLRNNAQLTNSIFLILSPFVLLIVYLFFLWIMKAIIRTQKSLIQLALVFAFSLVPIAVVYNVAHYYTLLIIQGQGIIGLASDPLGNGWNIFYSAGYTPNISIIGAATVWYSQIALIVLGHMAAVYIAHVEATKLTSKPKKVLYSQFPMLGLMVLYTMLSLWIIAQPITIKKPVKTSVPTNSFEGLRPPPIPPSPQSP